MSTDQTHDDPTSRFTPFQGIAMAVVAVKGRFMLNSPEPASTTKPTLKNSFFTLLMIRPPLLFWRRHCHVCCSQELDLITPYGRVKLGKGVR